MMPPDDALLEPEPENPKFKEYLGRMDRGSEEVAAEVIAKCKLWREKLTESGKFQQMQQNTRLYHNMDPDDDAGGEDAFELVTDEDGNEHINFRVNDFRTNLTHILNMVVTGPNAQRSRAANDEANSEDAAQMFDSILDYYTRTWKNGRSEKQLRKAVEYCLFLPNGYVFLGWDETAGGEYVPEDGDDGLQQMLHKGDLTVFAASDYDVFFDPEIEDEDELDCVVVRQWVNKYKLAAKLLAQGKREGADRVLELGSGALGEEDTDSDKHKESDLVALYHTYFPSSLLLPRGRYIQSTASGKPIRDDDNPYVDPETGEAFIPMIPVRAAEGIGSLHGYAPGNDIAAIQVARNKAWGVQLTNFFAFGTQSVAAPRGTDASVSALSGLKFYEYNPLPGIPGGGKPEGMNLVQEATSGFEIIDRLSKETDTSTAVNSVVKGDPESSLKAASGKALGLVEARAVAYWSGLSTSYQQLRVNFGNMLLKILQVHATAPRVIAIVGKNKVAKSLQFDANLAKKIAKIEVELVNPLSKTTPGLADQAEFLVANKMITQAQEYLNLINTGRWEPLVNAEQSQLNLIHQENEMIMRGEVPRCLKTDNDWRGQPTPEWPNGKPWHVASHETIAANVKLRQKVIDPVTGMESDNPALVALLQHLMEHQSMEPMPMMPAGPPGAETGGAPMAAESGDDQIMPAGPEQPPTPGTPQAAPAVAA